MQLLEVRKRVSTRDGKNSMEEMWPIAHIKNRTNKRKHALLILLPMEIANTTKYTSTPNWLQKWAKLTVGQGETWKCDRK